MHLNVYSDDQADIGYARWQQLKILQKMALIAKPQSPKDLFQYDFSKYNEDGALGNDMELKKFNKSFFHRFEDVQGLSMN